MPTNDEQAYDYAAGLAERYGYTAVYIERRRYIQYPFAVEWVNLLFFWDEIAGDIAA